MNSRVPAASLPRADRIVFVARRHLIVAHVLIEVVRIGSVLVLRMRPDLMRIVKLMRIVLLIWILWISWSVHAPVRCRHVAVPNRHLLHFNDVR